MNSLQTAKENLNSAKNWGLVVLLGLVAERRKKYSRRIRFAAEYHEYLERIGLASVEEHELTGLTKDIRLDVVAVTKEYRALYGPDTVSWYRSYEAEIR